MQSRHAWLCGVVIAGWVLAGCSRQAPPPAAMAVPVTVTRAVARDMPIVVAAPGTVEAINAVAVKSLVEGQLLESLVQDGADVQAGQLMFRIDPRPAQAALQQAEAALAKDRATLEQARSQVERYRDVAAKGYVSADQMEQYRTNLGVAQAAVKLDEANVEAARLSLDYTRIRAPISGRLGRIQIRPGNLVKANDANALVVINQIEPIYVNFALPGSHVGRVLAAQQAGPLAVRANVIGVAQPLQGRLAFVDNTVDSATGTIRLRGEFANDGHALWPGQLVSVELTLGHDAHAVVLPDKAVQNGPQGSYVYRVQDDRRAQMRAVSVARVQAGLAVIDSGVAAGDLVVLDGQSRVHDGSTLRFEEAVPAATTDGVP